jgi:GNAT superfamily N-acetyltransferase
MTATIRLALPADADGIVQVRTAGWQWAYRGLLADDYLDGLHTHHPDAVERFRAVLSDARARSWTFVAEGAGLVVGFVSVGASRDEGAPRSCGEVYALYIAEHLAGTGLGRTLFQAGTKALRRAGFTEATLWVLRGNARARLFYEAAGWRPDGHSQVEERPGLTLDEVRYRAAL